MIVGVRKETVAGERRVALVPESARRLSRAGVKLHVEHDAGVESGFRDASYVEQGFEITSDPYAVADVLLTVRPPDPAQVARLKERAAVIGLLDPFDIPATIEAFAAKKVTAFAMEFIPRITRAQAMDALSAMSTVAGYKAVLLAASRLTRFFPMLMTAAGTVTPARVFVVGAGVAGLQAIGTARRLGAVVEAYDTRPAVKEQVMSLGAKFVDLPLDTATAEGKGGYAAAQSQEFYQKQQELMTARLAASDVVITTALVPGKRAPILITAEMVDAMQSGSIIVDLAAERGGNCALTVPGEEVTKNGVAIIAPLNIASTVPVHASQMYARTVTNFLLHLCRDGQLQLEGDDELTIAPMITRAGKVLRPDLIQH